MNKEQALCNLKYLHPHDSSSLSAILDFFFSPCETKNPKLQHYTQPHRAALLPTKGVQEGWDVSMTEPRAPLFDELDVSSCLCGFSGEFLSEWKISSLDVFIVSILPHLYLLQPNQAFRVVLSTVSHAAWLINSLPIGGYYSTQPGSTAGLLGSMAVCLAGTSPVWCNHHWFKLCSLLDKAAPDSITLATQPDGVLQVEKRFEHET